MQLTPRKATAVAKLTAVLGLAAMAGSLFVACQRSGGGSGGKPQPKIQVSIPVFTEHFEDQSNELKNRFPMSEQALNAIINPKGVPDYDGPTGVVSGHVTVSGDPSPVHAYANMPIGCGGVPERYGALIRKGPDGSLEEAVVAIIGMKEFVRPSRVDKTVQITKCVVEPRTIDLSIGQRLMVHNNDGMPWEPKLLDLEHVHQAALHDQTVPVFVTRPGIQRMTWFAGTFPGQHAPEAVIWAFPNALHQVTGSDGKFRITGVPPGKLTLEVSHNYIKHAVREIEVKANAETKVEVNLEFHWTPTLGVPSASASVSASASSSTSAKPSASASH